MAFEELKWNFAYKRSKGLEKIRIRMHLDSMGFITNHNNVFHDVYVIPFKELKDVFYCSVIEFGSKIDRSFNEEIGNYISENGTYYNMVSALYGVSLAILIAKIQKNYTFNVTTKQLERVILHNEFHAGVSNSVVLYAIKQTLKFLKRPQMEPFAEETNKLTSILLGVDPKKATGEEYTPYQRLLDTSILMVYKDLEVKSIYVDRMREIFKSQSEPKPKS